MLIIIIIFVWYLTGFLPGRRINKQKNRYHSWGVNTKIYGFIDGDKGLLPWTSLPWPFGKPLFQASWRQILIGKLENLPKYNSIGKEISYSDPVSIAGVTGKIIDVTDTTNKIRKRNNQILDIEIQLPDSGLNFEITLGTIFIVEKPMKYLKLENGILVYSQRETKDALGPWFIKQEIDAWRTEWKNLQPPATTPNPLEESDSFGIFVVTKMESLRIDNLQEIIIPCKDDYPSVPMTRNERRDKGIPFRKYMDVRKLEEFGVKFGELSLELGYKKDVQDLKDKRQQQQVKKEERNVAIQNEKLQKVTRITAFNDAVNEKEIKTELWTIGKKIVDDIAIAQEKINSAYKASFLVLPQQHNDAVSQFINSMGVLQFSNQQKGGRNATQNQAP